MTLMNKFLLLLITLFCACGYPKPVNNLKVVDNNGLSSADKAMGWESLFDGKSMDLWKVYKEDGVRGWKIENDEMIALGLESQSADIVTKESYTDFELRLEWNISANGNSGIFFNVREDDGAEAVYYTGPEYQLVDDAGWGDRISDKQRSGSNYDIHPPRIDVTRPAGEWNQSRLIVDQGHVQHWLNGKKVVEYDLWTEEWQALKTAAKWKDYPAYGEYTSGRLALQDHGNQVRFRNIKVRRL